MHTITGHFKVLTDTIVCAVQETKTNNEVQAQKGKNTTSYAFFNTYRRHVAREQVLWLPNRSLYALQLTQTPRNNSRWGGRKTGKKQFFIR